MPTYPFFLLLSGTLLLGCGNKPEEPNIGSSPVPASEKKLRDDIAAYPDSPALRRKLIDYFVETGDYASAVSENEKLLQRYGNQPGLLDEKGRLSFLKGDTATALKTYETLVELMPAEPQFRISLATLYAQKGNPLALPACDSLIRNYGGEADLQGHFIKGLYHAQVKEPEIAVKLFDSCISMQYNFSDAYREKAIALHNLSKYLEAAKTLELQLSIDPGNEEAYYWLGRSFEKLNQKEQAVKNYRMAVQFDPGYAEALDALARLGEKP
jgi:tetratricopeptide (TPR) repeat protein